MGRRPLPRKIADTLSKRTDKWMREHGTGFVNWPKRKLMDAKVRGTSREGTRTQPPSSDTGKNRKKRNRDARRWREAAKRNHA